MTISKTTPLVQIGALHTSDLTNVIVFKHVYVIIVWRDNKIAWYDQYTTQGGYYLGRIKTLKYLKEAHDNVRRNGSNRERL